MRSNMRCKVCGRRIKVSHESHVGTEKVYSKDCKKFKYQDKKEVTKTLRYNQQLSSMQDRYNKYTKN